MNINPKAYIVYFISFVRTNKIKINKPKGIPIAMASCFKITGFLKIDTFIDHSISLTISPFSPD